MNFLALQWLNHHCQSRQASMIQDLNAAEQDVADQGEAGHVAVAQGLPRHQLFDDEDQGDLDLLKAGSVHYLNLYSHHQEEHQSLYHHHPAE